MERKRERQTKRWEEEESIENPSSLVVTHVVHLV
jgi:hypothetical protein